MKKKKIGFLLSTSPEHPNKKTVVALSKEALKRGHEVYLYLVDDGVKNLDDPEIQALKDAGVNLFLCAFGAQRRLIPTSDKGAFAGLVVLSDLVKGCDPFVTFN
ncbi:MAG TPA: DsrE family protein [Nitrospiria bacterium]|nr:DsrE family protein [Nitrospiria bacterium]